MCKLILQGIFVGFILVPILFSVFFKVFSDVHCSGEWEDVEVPPELEYIRKRQGSGNCDWMIGVKWNLNGSDPIFSRTIYSYSGQWAGNRKHGKGVYTSISGWSYDGMWEQDKRSGRGTFKLPDQSSLEGNWVDDKLVGNVCRLVLENRTYTGSIIDGLMDGMGDVVLSNGQIRSGQFDKGNIKTLRKPFQEAQNRELKIHVAMNRTGVIENQLVSFTILEWMHSVESLPPQFHANLLLNDGSLSCIGEAANKWHCNSTNGISDNNHSNVEQGLIKFSEELCSFERHWIKWNGLVSQLIWDFGNEEIELQQETKKAEFRKKVLNSEQGNRENKHTKREL